MIQTNNYYQSKSDQGLIVLPNDQRYHTLTSIHLLNTRNDPRYDPREDISYRRLVCQKIYSYLKNTFIKQNSYKFSLQFIYERSWFDKPFHLHFVTSRLLPEKHLYDKFLLDRLDYEQKKRQKKGEKPLERYELVLRALELTTARVKINGKRIIPNGKKAVKSIVFDNDDVIQYLSKNVDKARRCRKSLDHFLEFVPDPIIRI